MDIKRALTFEEQTELLIEKGFEINNKNKVTNFLSKNNYYKVSGYFNMFENNNEVDNINFDRIINCYEFDRKMMNFLYSLIGEIETFLKAQISNYLALKHNPLIYMSKEFFRSADEYNFFKEMIEGIKEKTEDKIIKHHLNKYDGNIPIWVIIEYLSFGNISKFYANLKHREQKELGILTLNISKYHMTSWLRALTNLRNRCAHYGRLYNHTFVVIPRNEKNINYVMNGMLFSQLLVIKYIHSYMDKEKWNDIYKKALFNLIEEYKGIIELEKIGFPENWKELL